MRLDPRTTALLIVHCQGDIVGPAGAFSGLFHQQVVERNVIGTIKALADDIRAADALVVYTRVMFAPDLSDLVVNSPLLGAVEATRCLRAGTASAEIVDLLKPRDLDIVIDHQRVSGFSDSALHDTLRDNGISHLVVTGVATNISVESTARAAGDLGYHVVIAADACSASTAAAHEASIESLSLLAEIATTADISRALVMVSGTNS